MRSISARIRAVDRRRAVVSILNLARRLSFFRGRRTQDTGARKSKDYVARPGRLVKVARVQKYRLCKVAEDGRRIEFENSFAGRMATRFIWQRGSFKITMSKSGTVIASSSGWNAKDDDKHPATKCAPA
jgi:hypothetical protein